MTRIDSLALGLVLAASSSSLALGQDLDFQINAAQSSADVRATSSTALPSSVIGDWDAADNPGGTRTVPGFFGGSGNNAIPMDLALGTSSAFVGSPTGSFGLDVNALGFTAEVHDLDIDLLGGGTADSGLSLTFSYDTFRTFAPDSLYIGGVPFTVPLAGQALSNLRLVQTAAVAPAALVPGANPGELDFAAVVPVDLSFDIDLQGQVTPVGPLPALLPLTGTLVQTGGGATVRVDFAQALQQQLLDPVPGLVIDDLPLPLPTILPPGATANLLLDASIASVDVDLAATVALIADAAPSCGFSTYCDPSPNSTGAVGQLLASGSAVVADNALQLSASSLPAGVNALVFMSQSRAELPILGSQGLLCLGAPQIRFFGQIQNTGASGSFLFSPDLTQLPQGIVFQPGSTWNFQVWHRDMNPMNTSNTTRAAEVRFCM